MGRWFRNGWRCFGTLATPTPNTADIRKRIGISIVLFRLLLVNLSDQLIDGAVGRTGSGFSLRKKRDANEQYSDRAADIHLDILALPAKNSAESKSTSDRSEVD